LRTINKLFNQIDCNSVSKFTQSFTNNTEYALFYYICGLAKSALGDKQGAIRDYTQTIRINPNYAEAYFYRGLVKYDLGDKQGALSDLRTAVQLFQQTGDQIGYQKVLREAQKRSLLL